MKNAEPVPTVSVPEADNTNDNISHCTINHFVPHWWSDHAKDSFTSVQVLWHSASCCPNNMETLMISQPPNLVLLDDLTDQFIWEDFLRNISSDKSIIVCLPCRTFGIGDRTKEALFGLPSPKSTKESIRFETLWVHRPLAELGRSCASLAVPLVACFGGYVDNSVTLFDYPAISSIFNHSSLCFRLLDKEVTIHIASLVGQATLPDSSVDLPTDDDSLPTSTQSPLEYLSSIDCSKYHLLPVLLFALTWAEDGTTTELSRSNKVPRISNSDDQYNHSGLPIIQSSNTLGSATIQTRGFKPEDDQYLGGLRNTAESVSKIYGHLQTGRGIRRLLDTFFG